MDGFGLRGHLWVLRHRSQQIHARLPRHGQGTQPALASWVILTTTWASQCHWGEGSWITGYWVLGQTQPNPKPCTAVTSTGKLLLQQLLPLSSPNHIISWLSRRQRVPICQEGWAPLCFGHIIATKHRYFLPENSKFRCSQSEKTHIFNSKEKLWLLYSSTTRRMSHSK